MTIRGTDATQLAAAGMLGATVPELFGPMALLWVFAAMGICTIADSMVPPGAGRVKVAFRYMASVIVTLSVSYTASAWVEIYWPEWRPHVWAVRFGAVVLVGAILHPMIAAAPKVVPKMLSELWTAFMDRVRGRTAGS